MKSICGKGARVYAIFGGLVEHEKPIGLSAPENVVRTQGAIGY